MMRPRSGVVLFIVVIVIAMISLAAYSFSILMRSELHAARLHGDRLQSQMMVESGLSYLNAWADASRAERAAAGGLDDNEPLFRNLQVDNLDPSRPGLFSIVCPPEISDVSAEIDYFPAEDEQNGFSPLRFGVVNESSKLHLETLIQWDSLSPGAGREALMSIPNMNEQIADAILDWIDEDSEPREFGAEDEYYRTLFPARQPANQVPDSMDGLLKIRGVTNELLFGFDRNRNYDVEEFERPHVHHHENSLPGESRDGELVRPSSTEQSELPPRAGHENDNSEPIPEPWSRFLTVTSAERNVDYLGRTRIFLNEPDLRLLHKQLAQRFNAEVANYIVVLRQYGPYEGDNEQSRDTISSVNLAKSASYEIDNLGSLYSSRASIGSNEQSPVYASPWQKSESSQEIAGFSDFCDAVCINKAFALPGRINVNLAPREVLMALPGLTSEQVDNLIASRSTFDSRVPSLSPANGDRPARSHPFWLVEEEILDVKQFEQLSPFLTVGGDVLTGQIVGYYVDDSPVHRVEVIVDGTDGTSRPIYYADLDRYGRGYFLDQLVPPSDAFSETSLVPENTIPQLPTRELNSTVRER